MELQRRVHHRRARQVRVSPQPAERVPGFPVRARPRRGPEAVRLRHARHRRPGRAPHAPRRQRPAADLRQRITTISEARLLRSRRGVSPDRLDTLSEMQLNAGQLLADLNVETMPFALPTNGYNPMHLLFSGYADALLPFSNEIGS